MNKTTINLRAKIATNARLQAIIVILLGGGAVLSVVYLRNAMHPQFGNALWILAESIGTIGIALIGFGFFGLMLDAKNWRDYFSERLKEIVIEKDYLNSLDASTLRELQVNALKAQFKNPSIDREGSFLHYFHTHLHKFISEPYREDVSVEMIMELDENSFFSVYDKVNYVCRASAGRIQNNVKWKPDKGEFESVQSLSVMVKLPGENNNIDLYNKSGEELNKDLEKGVEISLSNYKDKDGLSVTVQSHYKIHQNRFQYWQMAHPTKNSDITIKFPDKTGIQYKTLFMTDVDKVVTEGQGYLKIKYNTWLLPQSGIVWKLNCDFNKGVHIDVPKSDT